MYDRIAMPGPRTLHHTQAVDAGAPAPPPLPPPGAVRLPPPPAPRSDPRRPPERGECRCCGSLPTTEVTLRSESGMVIMRRRERVEGTFCRSCGLATFRSMMDHTLAAGWWGLISFFVNWTTIARNLVAWRRIVRLGPPEPNPSVHAASPQPLDPGPPVHRRGGAAVFAIVLLGVVATVVVLASMPSPEPEPSYTVTTPGQDPGSVLATPLTSSPPPSRTPPSGSCVRLTSDRTSVAAEVPCDGGEDATVVANVPAGVPCPMPEHERVAAAERVLCLEP